METFTSVLLLLEEEKEEEEEEEEEEGGAPSAYSRSAALTVGSDQSGT